MDRRQGDTHSCLSEHDLAEILKAGLSESINGHIDECSRCFDLVASITESGEDDVLVGRYQLERLIGQGAHGAVYCATDLRLGRKVAVKLLAGGDAEQRKRLLKEARALAKIKHPNVLRVYDVGESKDCAFLATELIEGESLSDYAKGHSRRQVIAVLGQVADGIAFVHSRGILHRDIKPENCLVESSRVVICDFGLSMLDEAPEPDEACSLDKSQVTVTKTTKVAGTPRYMAPELFCGQPASEQSDLYSLAATCWECLHGHPPHRAMTQQELVTQKQCGPPQIGTKGRLDRYQRALVRALSPEPECRQASVSEFATAFVERGWPMRSLALAAVALVALISFGIASRRAPDGAILKVTTSQHSSSGPCQHAGRPVQNLWQEMREDVVYALERKLDAKTASRYAGFLDDQISRWQAAQVGMCKATYVERVTTEEVYRSKQECVSGKRRQLQEVLREIVESDESSPQSLPKTIPAIRDCQYDAVMGLDGIEGALEGENLTRHRAIETLTNDGKISLATEHAEKWYEQASGKSRVLAAVIYAHLLRQHKNHDEKAETVYRSVIAQAASEGDSRSVGRAWLYLAEISLSSNRLKESETRADSAESFLVLAGRPPRDMASLENIRGLLAHRAGDYDGAVEHITRSAKLHQHAELWLDAGTSHVSLARLAMMKRLPEKALDHIEKARVLYKRILSPSHPHHARLWEDMGHALSLQGKSDEAIAAHEKALELRQSIFEPDNLLVVESKNDIAMELVSGGKFEEAETLLLQVLSSYNKYPQKRVATKQSMTLLALSEVRLKQERFHVAKQFAEQAVKLDIQTFGKNHPETLKTRYQLVDVYSHLSLFDSAQEQLDICRGIITASQFGKLEIAVLELAQARTYARQGKTEQARRLATKTLKDTPQASHIAKRLQDFTAQLP